MAPVSLIWGVTVAADPASRLSRLSDLLERRCEVCVAHLELIEVDRVEERLVLEKARLEARLSRAELHETWLRERLEACRASESRTRSLLRQSRTRLVPSGRAVVAWRNASSMPLPRTSDTNALRRQLPAIQPSSDGRNGTKRTARRLGVIPSSSRRANQEEVPDTCRQRRGHTPGQYDDTAYRLLA